MISGRSGLPKLRLLVAPIGSPPAHATLRADFGDGEHRAAIRIEVTESAVAVHRNGQPAVVPLTRDNAGGHARLRNGVGPTV